MPLRSVKAERLYDFVTHTHTHLGGKCSFDCQFCYVNAMPFERPPKYRGAIRLMEEEFSVKYKTGKTVLMENSNDLFTHEVPRPWIKRVFEHCIRWPENTYVWLTQNPKRYVTLCLPTPPNSMWGATIESDIDHISISWAPPREARKRAMERFESDSKFLCIEPILDFDPENFTRWIKEMKVRFIILGADTRGHSKLPEPKPEKVEELIKRVHDIGGVEIKIKKSLARLMQGKSKLHKNV